MTVACASASAQQAEETKPIGNNAALPTVDVVANQSGQSQEETEQKNGSLTVLSVAKQRQQLDETVGSVAFVDAATPRNPDPSRR